MNKKYAPGWGMTTIEEVQKIKDNMMKNPRWVQFLDEMAKTPIRPFYQKDELKIDLMEVPPRELWSKNE